MATITTYGYTNFFDHGRVSEVQDWSSEQIDITYPGGYSTFRGFGFAWVEANEWWQGTATFYSEYDRSGRTMLEIKDFAAPAEIFQKDWLYSLGELLAGDDTLMLLGATDDVVFAGAGNDVIYSYRGAKDIHGQDGIDTVVYELASSNYDLKRYSDGLNITGNGSDDLLYSVERVAFSDGLVAFDANAAQTYRLYQAAFDRTPDDRGLSYWIGEVDGGMNLHNLSRHFINSSEFRDIYGANVSPTEFVARLYSNILGREGEATGVAFWVDEIESGRRDSASVLADFSESDENVALVGQVINEGIWIDFTA
ncbi:MAG: DUF4214 domain-containing protein [Devosia sp.]|uniref:DUF4214 domain-containing protein n=1 Tax=Devosia sp. TaxID=1871048 RepID=UPI0019F5886A|nr:DUF4214 domain-containing protein [Devosia sp.]MBF0678442.1 DUF4214 domain-containing protein [Devosia sp.]